MYIFRKVLSVDPIADIIKENNLVDCVPLKELHVTVALNDRTKDVKLDDNIIWVKNIKLTTFFNGYHVFLLDSNYLQDRFNYFKEIGFPWDYEEYRPHISFTNDTKKITFSPFDVLLGPETIKS